MPYSWWASEQSYRGFSGTVLNVFPQWRKGDKGCDGAMVECSCIRYADPIETRPSDC
jgi:hypothetical protein